MLSFLATRGDRHSRGSVQRRAAAGTGGTGDTTGHLAASEHWLTKQQASCTARPTSRLTRTKIVFRRPLQSSRPRPFPSRAAGAEGAGE